ncbi:hypothetical protein WISP_87221 [Willisornis vidua]|uniref:Uncharacterized protein n=1 Tax=Willisornis vidua TaxID=1566151 RepID=A0ABQ9D865_9PASS|nr:hypothetical protein WISP_87221 [Willisornis vidua]
MRPHLDWDPYKKNMDLWRPDFGSGMATGVASVKGFQKLCPCPVEPMPGSSRMDPLLAKAKPIRNDSNTSVTTEVAQMKIAAREEQNENM